jgi:large subunit ribosomal protein L24
MKIKVGDMVEVISGSCKGKEGKVVKVLRSENRVIVEKVNIVKKHVKPSNTNETGGILEIEAPIHISNVKVVKKEKKAAKEVKKATKTVKKTTKKESKK